MQVLLNDWLCGKYGMEGIGWFWFEGFDQPSKYLNSPTEKWETQWGLFGSDRQLKKGVHLPQCAEGNGHDDNTII